MMKLSNWRNSFQNQTETIMKNESSCYWKKIPKSNTENCNRILFYRNNLGSMFHKKKDGK